MLNLNVNCRLEEIFGIGPVFSGALENLGFSFDIDLLTLPENSLISHISQIDGLSASMLAHSILPQARFLRLPGVDGEIADALLDAGYLRYSDFLGVQTSTIERVISKAKGKVDSINNSSLACELLLTAVQLAVTGNVRVIVQDSETREPMEGVQVSYAGDRRKSEISYTKRLTDERGIVNFEGIPRFPTSFRISAEGFLPQTILAAVDVQSAFTYKVSMSSGLLDMNSVDEFSNGLSVGFTSLPLIHKTTELASLPSRPPVLIESIKNDKATLGSLWFRQQSDHVIIPRIKVLVTVLPINAKVGDVLIPEGSMWLIHPDSITPSEFRQNLIRERRNTFQGIL